MSYEDLFLSKRAVIQGIARKTCRLHWCRREDIEDFASEVDLKFIADDYAVLRSFRGECSLPTFLTTVIQRLFLDYRNHLWGKWRPSAAARRQGPLAERLESLIARDGLKVDEAIEVLRTSHGVARSVPDLKDLAGKLRLSSRWRRVEEAEAAEVSDRDSLPDRGLLEDERYVLRTRVMRELGRAIFRLSADEKLILKMRWEDGATTAAISRILGLASKPFYRRVERIHRHLERMLVEQGVDARLVEEVLAEPEGSSSSMAWTGVR